MWGSEQKQAVPRKLALLWRSMYGAILSSNRDLPTGLKELHILRREGALEEALIGGLRFLEGETQWNGVESINNGGQTSCTVFYNCNIFVNALQQEDMPK